MTDLADRHICVIEWDAANMVARETDSIGLKEAIWIRDIASAV